MYRLLIVFLVCAIAAQAANKLSRRERKDGFVLLFDGKTLQHWHSVKLRPDAGAWLTRKGTLTWTKGGSWLATDDMYYDFVLRLEYRTGADSNSGIFLRAAAEGNPAFSGMELQILSDGGKAADVHSTGSLYGAIAPARSMAKAAGEWNHVEIIVEGQRVIAIWNGVRVIDAELDDPAYAKAQERPLSERAPFGHIGLQAYSSGAPVEFRNIKLKVLKVGPGFPKHKAPIED